MAYLLFANGQEDLLHRPVTLYSFLQKFCVFVLTLYVQWPWLMTCNDVAVLVYQRESVRSLFMRS